METLPLPNDLSSWNQTKEKLTVAYEKCLLAAETLVKACEAVADNSSLDSKHKKLKLSCPACFDLIGEVFDNLQGACEYMHGDICPKNIFGELKNLVLNATKGTCSDLSFSIDEAQRFMSSTLPCVIQLVMDLPSLDIRLPKDLLIATYFQHSKSSTDVKVYELTLQRKQVSSLLATMFLCLIPHKTSELNTQYNIYDYMEFFPQLGCESQLAKLRMVLCYFNHITVHGKPTGLMSFQRMVGQTLARSLTRWCECDMRLCDMEVRDSGKIEDCYDALQVDFANEYIGGGVLGGGDVQAHWDSHKLYNIYGLIFGPAADVVSGMICYKRESGEEIRLCIAPECQVSLIFMRQMLDNESIRINGFQTYSTYSGYGYTLKYAGPCEDKSKLFEDGTLCSSLTAIDAIPLYEEHDQYVEKAVVRELNKAYTGFIQPITGVVSSSSSDGNRPVYSKDLSSPGPAGRDLESDDMPYSTHNGRLVSNPYNQMPTTHQFAMDLSQSIVHEALSTVSTHIQDSKTKTLYRPVDGCLLQKDVGIEAQNSISNSEVCVSGNEKQPKVTWSQIDTVHQPAVSPCQELDSVEQHSESLNHYNWGTFDNCQSNTADIPCSSAYPTATTCRTTTSSSSNTMMSNFTGEPCNTVNSISSNGEDPLVGVSDSFELGSSLSDSAKEPIYRYSLSVACDIIARSVMELRERRRLFISNDVSPVEFSAANTVSEKLLEQVFHELQTEADNSISDSEKLSKMPTRTVHPLVSVAGHHSRRTECSYLSVAQPYLSSQPQSSTVSQSNPLQPTHATTTTHPTHNSTNMKSDEANKSKCLSKSVQQSCDRSQTGRGNTVSQVIRADSASLSNPKLTSSGSKRKPEVTDLHLGSSELKSHDMAVSSDPESNERVDVSVVSCHNDLPSDSQRSLKPALNSSADSIQFSTSISPKSPTLKLLSPAPDGTSTVSCQLPLTTLQYEDLRVYSEIVVETSLHSALREITSTASTLLTASQHGGSALSRVPLSMPDNTYRRPIATGNWGCGVFGGDPQLKSMLQWIAASKAKCPKLVYYTFNDDRVGHKQLSDMVKLLSGKSVNSMTALIMSYIQGKAKRSRPPLFQFIRDKLSSSQLK